MKTAYNMESVTDSTHETSVSLALWQVLMQKISCNWTNMLTLVETSILSYRKFHTRSLPEHQNGNEMA